MEKQMTEAELVAEIERLQKLNANLTAKQPHAPGLTLKVGKAGGVVLYGLGRFPVTLYRSQWERLLGHKDAIQAFITANASQLKEKVAK